MITKSSWLVPSPWPAPHQLPRLSPPTTLTTPPLLQTCQCSPILYKCPVQDLTRWSLPILIWPAFPVSFYPQWHPSPSPWAIRGTILLHLSHLGKFHLFCQDPANASLLGRFSRLPGQCQSSHVNGPLWLTAWSTEQQPLAYLLGSPSLWAPRGGGIFALQCGNPESGSKLYSVNSSCTDTFRKKSFFKNNFYCLTKTIRVHGRKIRKI